MPAAFAWSTWAGSIWEITYITDEKFNIFLIVVEPSRAIPQDQIETGNDARSMNEVAKVEMMIIFENLVASKPSFVFGDPL